VNEAFVTISSQVALPGDKRTEAIARAIYAYNQYPGRKASEIPWPPERKQTLMRTWNMATAIVQALDEQASAGSVR
jgi:hypothetical protein